MGKVESKTDIRKYFTNLGETFAKNYEKNSAIASKCPVTAKNHMEPSSDLWQGGVKTKMTKTETKKINYKRSRTSLCEDESEEDQHVRKKRREDGDLILTREEKMKNEMVRGEEAWNGEQEWIFHTLVDEDKPARNPSESLGSKK